MQNRSENIRDRPAAEENWYPVPLGLILEEFDQEPGYFIYRPRGAPHWVILHTLAGVGRFTSVAGIVFDALPGDTTVIPAGAGHDFGVRDEGGRWRFQFAQFRPRPEWLALLEWPELAPGLLQIHTDGDARARVTESLATAIRLSHGVSKNRELFGMNSLELALLWCDAQNPAKPQVDPRLLEAVDLIEKDLRAELDVRALAHAGSLSVSRFSYLFREQLGTSPQRFLEQRRLDAAARLLDLTTRTVASVAAEVGFRDPLYFSTRFRSRMGLSPSEFRRRREFLG